MRAPFERLNRSASSLLNEPDSPSIQRRSCISRFSWHIEEGKRMKFKYGLLMLVLWVFAGSRLLQAQAPSDASPGAASISIDKVIDRAIEQERSLAKRMTGLSPLIETYTQ